MSRSDFEKYGFDMVCRCQEDTEQGNVEVVPVCYLNRYDLALETLELYKKAYDENRAALAHLRVQVVELGGEPRA